MPSLELDPGTLSFEAFGDAAAPGLFLIHGLHGDSASVRPLAERLAERFHVIAPDMLGHGESERLDAFTLEDQATALNQLIVHYGYPEAHVVGYSMGSYIAARAAIQEPDHVQRLVLVCPKAAENLSREERRTNEESIEGFDLRPGLPTVTARTLVLSGAEDGLNPPEAGRAVADLIPGARFEVYERSGHMLPYEEIERFTADVTAFLTAD